MYLAADGTRLVLPAANLVQAQDFARRVVELVVIDLDMGECSIKLHIDVALPGGKAQVGHSDVQRAVFVCEGCMRGDVAGCELRQQQRAGERVIQREGGV